MIRATVGRIIRIAGWQKGGLAGKGPAMSRSSREILEPRELANERELHDPRRAVALLRHDQFPDALPVGRRLGLVLIHVLAINEHDDVAVLVGGARGSKIPT